MTKRELRKLSRADLLEMLLWQRRENERLRAELEQANRKLANREIVLEHAGSIAEASLLLNGVFEAAQAACAQYIENIQLLSKKQEALCTAAETANGMNC